MKKLLTVALFLMVGLTLGACNLLNEETQTQTLMTFEVNPSIEIILDEDDKVSSIAFLNEDAEIAFSDLDLEGLNIDEAIDLINDALIDTGYLDIDSEDNLITITLSDEKKENEMIDKVKNSLERRGIGAAIFGGGMQDEYRDLAEAYDISPGLARMISRVVEIDESLSFEEALELEPQERMEILQEAHRSMMDEFIQERQQHAKQMRTHMKDSVFERVQEHRQNIQDGNFEDIDFDDIHQSARNQREDMRQRYQERIDEAKERAAERGRPHDDE